MSEHFEASLRRQLVAAAAAVSGRAARPSRRRAGWWVAAGVGVAAVVAGVLVAVGPDRAVAPSLAVNIQDGLAVVELLDPQAPTERLERELADAGIDARVHRLAASPSAVGAWVGAVRPDGRSAVSPGERVPWDSRIILGLPLSGTVDLFLGVATGAHQTYAVSASAFSPGEPLHCSKLGGQPAEQAAAVLTDRGLDVLWHTIAGHNQVSISPAAPGTVPVGVVAGAEMQSAAAVRVYVTRPDTNQPRLPDIPAEELPPDVGPEPSGAFDIPFDPGLFALTTEGSWCKR